MVEIPLWRTSPFQHRKHGGYWSVSSYHRVVRGGRTALILGIVLFLVVPLNESPPVVAVRAKRAQEIIEDLRAELAIDQKVQMAIVAVDPFVFSAKPIDMQKDGFLVSMEIGFLLELEDDELRAALSHELGHVWIFTHFPFLQTERLANEIGERAVYRGSFENLYSKLWKYEGTRGVPFAELLGPDSRSNNARELISPRSE